MPSISTKRGAALKQRHSVEAKRLNMVNLDELADSFRAMVINDNQVSTLTDKIMSNNWSEAKKGAHGLRVYLSGGTDVDVRSVVLTGVTPRLVTMLGGSDDGVLQDVTWCVTNIAAGCHADCQAIVEAGGIPKLATLLGSSNPIIRDHVTWALGNLCGDCTDYRDIATSIPGFIEILLESVKAYVAAPEIAPATAIWVLSNVWRRAPRPTNLNHTMGATVDAMIGVLGRGLDDTVLADACWALDGISHDVKYGLHFVTQRRLTKPLCRLLARGGEILHRPVIRIIGHGFAGTDEETDWALADGALSTVIRMFSLGVPEYTKEASWICSNIAAGTIAQNDILTKHDVYNTLRKVFYDVDDDDIKREVGYAFANLSTCGAPHHVQTAITSGGIDILCWMLDTECLRDTTGRTAECVLDALGAMLKEGERVAHVYRRNVAQDMIVEANGVQKMRALQEGPPGFPTWERCGKLLTHFAH